MQVSCQRLLANLRKCPRLKLIKDSLIKNQAAKPVNTIDMFAVEIENVDTGSQVLTGRSD